MRKPWLSQIVISALGLLAAALSACGTSSTPVVVDAGGDKEIWSITDVANPDWYEEPDEGQGQLLAGLYSLNPAQTCDDLDDQARKALVAKMKQDCFATMKQILEGRECHDYWGGGGDISATCDAGAIAPGEDAGGASEYSTTNLQEVDVDEPDFIKNDGNYIYILAGGNSYGGANLQIWDVWPAAESHLLSSTEIAGYPHKLFVYEGRAVVFSSSSENPGSYDCSYGYDCEFTGYPGNTVVTVLDISDVASPKVLRKLEASSALLGARRVDGRVFVALVQDVSANSVPYDVAPEELKPYVNRCIDEELPFGLEQVQALYATLVAQNEAAILAGTITIGRPHMTDTAGEKTFADPYQDCANYYFSSMGDTQTVLSVLSFDLLKTEAADTIGVLARGGVVYASKDSLFVALRYHRYSWEYQDAAPVWFEELSAVDEATVIHGFTLSGAGGAVTYNGSGVVEGRFLNQFAFSKKDDYLRVTTTTGQLPGNAYNSLFIMKRDGKDWKVEGKLSPFGENEDVRSVRYNGDYAYVVTFKKTDPLFVIDVSDPKAPVVKGELQIPGFSTYMHFMDEQHIMSIGYDADDHGDFAYFDGLQLQIFDITTVTDPKLLWKEVIGTRGSASEAAGNHFAFNYFKARNLLAIPMSICEGGDDGQFGYTQTFDGLLVYEVTLADGFKKLGGIDHMGEGEGTQCGEWWTEMKSSVKRSVIMEDWVYSVAMDRIKVANKNTLNQIVAELDLAGN